MPRMPVPAVTRLAPKICLAPLLLLAIGCNEGARGVSQEAAAGREARRRASQSSTLFDSAKRQLRSLPEMTPMDLAPPTVLLDARTSGDNQDVLAILTPRPGAPVGSPSNQLSVPKRNARFRGLGVRPGDNVKYFIKLDRDTMERLRETGEADIVTYDAYSLPVAQVIDDHTLLIAGGFPSPIESPARIEIWRNVDARMREISNQLQRYVTRRDPPLAWQPSPDERVLKRIVEQLNQWLRQRIASDQTAWQAPAALADLPADLRQDERLAALLAEKQLAGGSFTTHDGRLVQGAVWSRGVGRWVTEDSATPIEQATELFDWTVRNLQLILPGTEPPRLAWQRMLHGRATAEGRVEVFVGLCRQRGIEAVAVVVPETRDQTQRTLAGVLDEGRLYLFDPTLGLPLPGGEGQEVATLAQLQRDDSLLRRLDLEDAPYPLTADRLTGAGVRVVAEPFSLSRRAALLESRLSGKDSLALAVDPAVVVDRLKVAEGVGRVALWSWPFENLSRVLAIDLNDRKASVKEFLPFAWRPSLWKGRALYFRGIEEAPDTRKDDALADPINDHREARQLYMSRRLRPPNKHLASLGSPEKVEIYRTAKSQATYWLGTIGLDRGQAESAKNWLENRLLDAPEAAWIADGVRYSRARVHEALGDAGRAIELLETDESPQRHGNRLRARRLRESVEEPTP